MAVDLGPRIARRKQGDHVASESRVMHAVIELDTDAFARVYYVRHESHRTTTVRL